MAGVSTRRTTRATRHVDQNTGQRTARTVTTRKRTDVLKTKEASASALATVPTTAPPARKRKALGDNTNAGRKKSANNATISKDKKQARVKESTTDTTGTNGSTSMRLVVEIPLRKRRAPQQPKPNGAKAIPIIDSDTKKASNTAPNATPAPTLVVSLPQSKQAGNPSREVASHVEPTSTISRSPHNVTQDPPLQHGVPEDEPPTKRRRSNRHAAVPVEPTDNTAKSNPAPPAQEQNNPSAISLRSETTNDVGLVPTQPWDDLDAEDEHDPLMVAEYVAEIFGYIKGLELNTMPSSTYMNGQPELEWRMRGMLMDWLIQVHASFRLLPETIFIAANIIDRFLSLRVVSLVKLQLVGITGLLIAAKYEEIMPPSVRDFLKVSDSEYDDRAILEAEKYILRTLDWNLSYPNPLNWLRRASKADEYDMQTRTLAKFLIEISVVEERLLKYTPSMLAAAALWLARLILDRSEWSANLEHYSGYPEVKLIRCANVMVNFLLQPIKHESLWKKYSGKRYFKCAIYARRWAEVRWPPDPKCSSEGEEGDESVGPVEVDLAAALPILREQALARTETPAHDRNI